MSIFDEQISRKPDRYPWTKDFIRAFWSSFWTPDTFDFKSDIHDYKVNLTEQEREIVVRTASAIAQIEVAVKTFWAKLGTTLPHPSVIDLSLVMAHSEVVHNKAYEKLLDVLNLNEVFEENLKLDIIQGRVQYLRKYLDKVYTGDNKKQFIYSLILFTLFVERTSLFSQFYIIMWLNRNKNILKDMAQQILYTKNEECHSEDTEVLTPQGWKDFREINVGDDVVEYHTDGTFKFTKVVAKTEKDFTGNLVHFSRAINQCRVTPKHDMLYYNQHGQPVKKKAQDLKLHTNVSIPIGGVLDNKGISKLSFEDRLRIAIQADGHTLTYINSYGEVCLSGSLTGKGTHRISLKKQRKKERLEWILDNCGFKYTKRPVPSRKDYHNYRIHYNHNFDYKEFDWIDLTDKTIEWCREFIEELVQWDGYYHKVKNCLEYYSINKRNIDIVQTIGILGGYRTSIFESKRIADNHSNVYRISLMSSTLIPISSGMKKSLVPYSGKVYCVTVPSGNIMTRYQNKTFIAGNCLHAQIGTKLINTIQEEFPDLFDEDLKERVISEAKEAFKAESKIVDWMLGDYKDERISQDVLKEYIKYTINESLVGIGYERIFDIDPDLYRDFEWFVEMEQANVVTDFFNRHDTGYVKNSHTFTEDDLF